MNRLNICCFLSFCLWDFFKHMFIFTKPFVVWIKSGWFLYGKASTLNAKFQIFWNAQYFFLQIFSKICHQNSFGPHQQAFISVEFRCALLKSFRETLGSRTQKSIFIEQEKDKWNLVVFFSQSFCSPKLIAWATTPNLMIFHFKVH